MNMKRMSAVSIFFVILCMGGTSWATLLTIGTATYGGTEYNLIYDEDAPMGPIAWLDYTNGQADWSAQNTWAASLIGALSYNLNAGYTVTWTGQWRQPTAGIGQVVGYDQTSSEMGHLYYEELGLKSYPDRGNSPVTEAELNASNFSNLQAAWYWTETDWVSNPSYALLFDVRYGYQGLTAKTDNDLYGLAVRGCRVSPVPEPATVLLFASGIVPLAALRSRLRRLP